MASDSPEQRTGGLAGLKQWFAGLPAAKRLNLVKGIGIAVAIGLLWVAYGASRNTEKPKKDQATRDVTTVSLGDSRLEDDIRAQFERDRQDMVSQSSQQTKVQNEQAAELTAQQKQLELMRQALESMNGSAPARTRGKAPPDDPEEWANAPTVSGERLNRTRECECGATGSSATTAAVRRGHRRRGRSGDGGAARRGAGHSRQAGGRKKKRSALLSADQFYARETPDGSQSQDRREREGRSRTDAAADSGAGRAAE